MFAIAIILTRLFSVGASHVAGSDLGEYVPPAGLHAAPPAEEDGREQEQAAKVGSPKERAVAAPQRVPQNAKAPRQQQEREKSFGVAEVINLGLTAALVWFSLRQAGYIKNQWRVMQRQAVIARGQLRQAKRASEQTDEVIKQMRSEQRPWLRGTVALAPFQAGVFLEFTIDIANSGPSPGAIETMTLTYAVQPKDRPFAEIREEALATSVALPSFVVVSPKSNATYRPPPTLKFDEESVNLLATNEWLITVFCRFAYGGANDAPHETAFCATYDCMNDRFTIAGDNSDNYMR